METTQGAAGIENGSVQPFPVQPVRRGVARVRVLGELRVPLTLSCAPRARLVRFPDGRLLWQLRLWEYDRAVTHLVATETLRAFARINRLDRLRAEIDEMVATARLGAPR